MANFPTKSTGSQVLTLDDRQLLQWTMPSGSNDELRLTPVAGKSFYETDKAKNDVSTVLHISPGVGDSGVIKDISMYNRSITPSGQTFISSSMTVSGAAGIYLDGTGDYIQSDSFTLDGDFTIECWLYPTSTTCKLMTIHDVKESNSLEIFRGGGTPTLRVDTGNGSANVLLIQGSSDISLNAWQHVTVVRNGSTLTLYKDGASIGSTTTSATFSGVLRLGAEYWNGSVNGTMTGYLADIRITKGTALYTSTFSPPSRQETVDLDKPAMILHNFNPGGAVTFHHGTDEPPTPPANEYVLYQDTPDDQHTVCLLHFDGENNSTVFRDVSRRAASAPKTITVVNDTKISTAEKKFGTSSGRWDGTGDSLKIHQHSDFNFGTGDFTLEMWVKTADTSGDYLFTYGEGNSKHLSSYISSPNLFFGLLDGSWTGATTSGQSVVDNEWHHVAFVRSGSTLSCYIDGISRGSTSNSTNLTTLAGGSTGGPFHIGGYSGGGNMDAYIDEVRISNVARYSGSFTPPTQPFGGGLRMKDPDGKIYALSLSGSA